MRLKAWMCVWVALWATLLGSPALGWEGDEPDWAADEATELAPAADAGAGGQAGQQAGQQAEQQREGRVALFVNPPEASIYVDGAYLGQGQYVGLVPLGARQLRFELAGHLTVQEVVTVEAGDGPVYLVVHMRPIQVSAPTYVGRTGGWVDDMNAQVAAWTLAGVGAVFTVSGAVLLAMDNKPSCQGCGGRFETTAAGATLTGLGAASLTAGVTFFLWDQLAGRRQDGEGPGGSERWSVGLSPNGAAGDRGGQVVIGGRW